MRRFLISGAVALALLASFGAAGASGLAGASGSAASGPRALLDQFVCQRALDPGQRLVSVRAVMRPLKGTRKLEMRFELLSKAPPATTFSPVQGTGLGSWVSPTDPVTLGQRPGDIWRLSHPVADLPAPASYRFEVTFRWIGPKGRVLGAQVRNTRNCVQPELRPDLAAVSFDAQPVAGHPKKNAYTAVIADKGLTGAGPFQIQFAFGTVVTDHTVKRIKPHQQLTFNFDGPVCESSAAPTMTIDPDQQVDDYNRANNQITATCPAPTPTS
jgi:hypothetical protein